MKNNSKSAIHKIQGDKPFSQFLNNTSHTQILVEI